MAGRVKSLAEDLVLTSGGPASVLFTAQLPEERADAAVGRTAMTVQRFVPQRVLGRSQGATVYAVLDSVTCTVLALKAHPHATITPLARHQVVRGSRVHTECSAHAHVLPLYAVFEVRAASVLFACCNTSWRRHLESASGDAIDWDSIVLTPCPVLGW